MAYDYQDPPSCGREADGTPWSNGTTRREFEALSRLGCELADVGWAGPDGPEPEHLDDATNMAQEAVVRALLNGCESHPLVQALVHLARGRADKAERLVAVFDKADADSTLGAAIRARGATEVHHAQS